MQPTEPELLAAVFPTPYGVGAVVVGPGGVCSSGLPDPRAREDAVRARLRGRHRGLRFLPAAELPAAARLLAWYGGDATPLDDVPLDLEGHPPFHRRVWTAARAIPRGRTLTYGEVAAQLGDAGAARAVGQALGRNPVPPFVPCHRVLAAGGTGGFSAPGGVDTKLRLLAMEGANVAALPTLFKLGSDGRLG